MPFTVATYSYDGTVIRPPMRCDSLPVFLTNPVDVFKKRYDCILRCNIPHRHLCTITEGVLISIILIRNTLTKESWDGNAQIDNYWAKRKIKQKRRPAKATLNVFTTETIYLLQILIYQYFKCLLISTRYK